MRRRFKNRREAGRQLADALEGHVDPDAVVLGLARGGIPVAAEIARRYGLLLDAVVVEKVRAPGHPELAIGAVTSRSGLTRNQHLIDQMGLSESEVEERVTQARAQLDEKAKSIHTRTARPAIDGRSALLVDDGIATGTSMEAAIEAARLEGATRIVVAVPVAPASTVAHFEGLADEVFCLMTPEPFIAVGAWYRDFRQLTDSEVGSALAST